ncbi:MAG: peptidase M23 [Candidatus Reconcilbacillus cellulovorans]|uniref:Peptidase M23 n=1 Tax=Candidatus Reconcilbacillus cellulovorans TaxID=1906605 RepID=A0A2A6E3E9_9BACL|nr:MAG: peptidase M23 [Candidatus Reconcilbacillus cellulovorans]
MRNLGLAAAAFAAAALLLPFRVVGADAGPAGNPLQERKAMFDSVSALTGIPWHLLAAIDQYERSLTRANPKSRTDYDGLIAIDIPEPLWSGFANPVPDDRDPRTIALFGGIGRDGDGDGVADPAQDLDRLWTMAVYLLREGPSWEDWRVALGKFYGHARSVRRIEQFAGIYAHFGRLELHDHAFPLPQGSRYSYRDTWGAGRSWGGARIHEGTDLFAPYGVPVRSTCYGVIETMGWNPYGGWRVGIRDLDNLYHYFAHLSGFNKKLKPGDYVSPGEVIGWVGSSGYGKPGTQGKFPPHLHFGLYRDAGTREWSFDPYPLLKKWEYEEKKRRR